MLNHSYATTYSSSFPPMAKRKKSDEVRLPVIVPVGFAPASFGFDDSRGKNSGVATKVRDARRSIALGLGTPRAFRTIHWSVDKDIVRSLPPQDVPTLQQPAERTVDISDNCENIRDEDLEENNVDELATKRRYTSVTANAAEEGALAVSAKEIPQSTLEEHCDPVRTCTQWNNWKLPPQPIPVAWDKSQTRVTDGVTPFEPTQLPRIPRRSPPKVDKSPKQFYRTEVIPGYTGYQPHLPVVLEHSDMCSPLTSTARSSYRKLPTCEYKSPHYPYQAPFSKMITLTYPYNPFNKIQAPEPLKLRTH